MLHLRAIAHLLRGRRLVGHGGGRRHRRLRQPAARHACPHERDRRETGTRRRADFPRCRRARHARRTTRTTARAMAARLRAARRIQPGHQRGISGPIPSRRLAAHDRRRGRRERSRNVRPAETRHRRRFPGRHTRRLRLSHRIAQPWRASAARRQPRRGGADVPRIVP
ncbi:hypothetical protein BAD_1307 [Bifidobacterium adolescentis ATCC 15703]|uniref:Uncharacterized protein n=1 Tax=Bifidobacterium adolescentis (strain ATCC 15703 / DSM 20083 / NCTC 11814 / E194a) TaxID=367928 RepID=A1A305_BIFAA|nr:hypothetical protein BAD_1307 [Bifidobacterium adolescentis ATCC 15703]